MSDEHFKNLESRMKQANYRDCENMEDSCANCKYYSARTGHGYENEWCDEMRGDFGVWGVDWKHTCDLHSPPNYWMMSFFKNREEGISPNTLIYGGIALDFEIQRGKWILECPHCQAKYKSGSIVWCLNCGKDMTVD